MARPRAPLWDDIATLPCGGSPVEREAFNRMSGSALTSPIELGPIMRIPWPRTLSRSFSCKACPGSSASAKPAVMTRSALTPAAAQSSTTGRTASRGTATTARSAPGGIWRAEG